jgi:hypothetical protein
LIEINTGRSNTGKIPSLPLSKYGLTVLESRVCPEFSASVLTNENSILNHLVKISIELASAAALCKENQAIR